MVGQGADEELRSLRSWLLESPEVRRHAKISWENPALPAGTMGTDALSVLQLATDNVWQIATFSISYAAWRKTRTRSPRVTLEYNGNSVIIEGCDPEMVERIIRSLSEE
ncbi:effector-associated constant component EACC1 [Streptomyces sp. NBC_01261]|uniref:effector-associated constant component EACC1 n=1 Tax=Streptomyces sp. NBC_01261 TaxID=2903802 RepID=UPI003FCDFCC5